MTSACKLNDAGDACAMDSVEVDCSARAACALDPITSASFYCTQVSLANCETRAKIRTNGMTSACKLNDAGDACAMDSVQVDLS